MSSGTSAGTGAENIHAGHRQRLRETFLNQGGDALQDVNLLELLLFYALPRRDTNALAHRLIDTFGSIHAVFAASPDALRDLGGLSDNTVALIKLTTATARRCEIRRAETAQILNTTRKCGDYLVPFFYGATQEEIYVLALDGKCKVLGCIRLARGSLSSATLNVRDVVEYAIRSKAASIILAHNHTSGLAVPSQEDIQTTRVVAHALDMVDVLLADHIVVADGDYVSMAESGQLPR